MNQLRHQYLQDVETRLRRLPDVDREQEMAEIAQHLDALIAARQSEGQAEKAATQAAIAQFGTAREIGGTLTQAGVYQRFAPWGEIVLFCAPVAALLSFVWFVFLCSRGVYYWGFDSYSDTPTASALRFLFINYGAYFIGWFVGLAAFLMLLARYGMRGTLRAAFSPASPMGGGIRWLLLDFLLGKVGPFLITQAVVVPQNLSLLNAHGSARFSYTILWTFTMWLAAYCTGRANRSRSNVANAVGITSSLPIAYSAFWMLLWYTVGNGWHASHQPASTKLYYFAAYWGTLLIGGAFQTFTNRFFAQLGEKYRPFPAKKETRYESAV